MKKILLISFGLILPLMTMATADRKINSYSELSNEVRYRHAQSPNFIGVELLGRAIGYSLNYDRAITNRASIGAGLTYYQFPVLGVNFNVGVVPIYGNYYFGKSQIDRFFLTGGVALWYAKAEISEPFLYGNKATANDSYFETVRAEGTAIYPNIGAGYEFRARTGFTARVTTYAEYIRTLIPWFGVTLGANF